MKDRFTHGDITKMLSSIIVVSVGIILYMLIQNISSVGNFMNTVFRVLSPFINGFVIAFILNGAVKFTERKIINKPKLNNKQKRIFALILVYTVIFSLLTLLIIILIPQLISSIQNLADNLPEYMKSFYNYLNRIFPGFFGDEILGRISEYWQKTLSAVLDYAQNSAGAIITTTSSVISAIVNVFVGIFVSVYLLADKEHFLTQLDKIIYAFMPKRMYEGTKEIAAVTTNTFNRYVAGQILDSLILGTMCFLGMMILRMPYAVLISAIITITNIIPILGPIIGSIPSFLIIFAISPVKAFVFIAFIIVLQQIDGNFMLPRIVGSSTGLKSFWVMFSIFIGGGLFGIPGMVLAVPAFSVFYYLLGKKVRQRIEIKKKSGFKGDHNE